MKTFLKIVGKYQSLIMFAIVAVVCTVCALNGPEHVTGLLVAAPVSLISFAKQEKDMTDEEKSLLGSIQLKCKQVCDEFAEGLIISRKTKCSTFAKHFVPKSHLLTQFKM